MHNYKRKSWQLACAILTDLVLLSGHIGAHNDQRPFDCYCGSAFTTKSDLRRHQHKSKKHSDDIDRQLATIRE